MEHSRKPSFIKGAAILAAASLICKVLGVLFRVFAIRILGEEGMFFYEKVYPTYSWLLIISSSGIPIAISRMVASRVARGAFNEAETVFKRAFWMLFVLGAVTTALMFLGAAPIAGFVLGSSDRGMILSLRALAPALFFTSILCAYRGYLQGLQRMTGTGLSQLAEQVFKMLFGLSLAFVLHKEYAHSEMGAAMGSVGILLGVTISEVLAVAVIYPIYRTERKRLLPVDFRYDPALSERHILRDLLAIAVPITLGASILPIANVVDSAMITRLLVRAGIPDGEANRLYVILCTYVRSIINLPAGLSTSLSMAVVPAIATAMAHTNEKGVRHLSAMSVKLAMTIGLPCAVGLSVLARPAIFLLYGSILPHSLDVAEGLMRIAAFTVVFISLSQTATGALQGVGKHRLPVYFLLIGGLTKIVVNLVCVSIPSVNIYGAVFSNLSCYGIAALLDTIALVVVTKAKLSAFNVFIKPIFASAIMGGFAYVTYRAFGYLFDLNRYLFSAIACVTAILVSIVVYLVLILALKVFTREELALVPGGRKLVRFFRN